MKKVLLLPALFLLAACNGTTSSKSEDAPEKEVDTLRFSVTRDSLVSDSVADFHVIVDIPDEAEAKNDSAAKELLRKAIAIGEISDTPHPRKKPIPQTISELHSSFIKEAKTASTDFVGMPPYALYIQALVSDKSRHYVTYKVEGEVYLGGAHGMPCEYHSTIDLTRGHILTWDDFFTPETKKELFPLLRSEVISQYYTAYEIEPGFAEGNYFKFDYPSLTPALTPKGVVFHWGAYEIDCYAAGMPSCVISYEKLSKLLRPEILQLVKERGE